MSAELLTVFSLSADAALTIFGVASALIVWVQDRTRRSNHYFALCMSLFAAYGAGSMVWHVVQQTGLDPKTTLHGVISLYVVGIVLLFNFVLSFAGLPRSLRRTERRFSFPLMIVFLVLLWSGSIYADFEPLDGGSYQHTVTPLGLAWAYIGGGYILAILWVVRRYTPSQERDIVPPLLFFGVGLMGFTLVPALREIPFNAVMVTVGIVLLGRVVLKYQVFKPLEDLIKELDLANDALIEASRKKSQFLANVSHELRTPLNSILGYTELVGKGIYGSLNETQADRLQKINRNGHELLALINDVLLLSKLEAGRFDVTPKMINVIELLDGLIAEFEPKANSKQLGLVRGYGKLPSVYADEEAVRNILYNLIDNALKFTSVGATILRGHYDVDRDQVVVSVTDTGPGIDPERHEQLFDVYLQAEDLRIREHGGTGLGLAIAYRLAELNGGHLWFESIVGQGTTFYLAIPVAEKLQKKQLVLSPAGRAKDPVILAIDDDQDALELLQDQLTSGRYRVFGVLNGNEGLKMAHDLKPALIALDVLMPDMDGWKVLEALRRDPATKDIPVLVISAADVAGRAHAMGAEGFIRKPATPHGLVQEVQRLLADARGRAKTQELEQVNL